MSSGAPGARCPTEDSLLAYIEGMLRPEEAKDLEHHLEGCDACCAVLAEAGRALAGSPVSSDGAAPDPAASHTPRRLPEVGERVGRYLLMDVIGKGAMGVVYAAYDPELDRRVAVKLVRGEEQVGVPSAEFQARLLGEAQAMARLSHPNVVAVHDIGQVDAGVYLAMELVPGQTLRDWLAAAERPWRAVVDAFLQAGDGLAAAHAAGLVHRDFKPDNVLIDPHGRVRVTDFGLARVVVGESGPESLPSSDLSRTRFGTIIGTPAYMAPEQLLGQPVDARADVFAFGASLYEALYQRRPYPAKTVGELEEALRRGVPAEPPPSRVPAWVGRVVLRALAARADARWPTMEATTRALRDDPAIRARRVVAPLVAVGLLAAIGAGTWWSVTADARACRGGAARADAVWDEGRQEAARASFGATGKAYASETYALASAALGAHLDAWRGARVEACDATHARGEQSDAMLDLRLRCLDQRLAETEALATVFAAADGDTVERATVAVGSLASPAVCGEAEWLSARAPVPLDPDAAAKVATSGELRARAQASELTGRWTDGLALAEQARALAVESGHLPSQAEATLTLARLSEGAGDLDATSRRYREAVPLGLAAGDDRLVAQAAAGLAEHLAFTTRSADEPRRWIDIARAEVARLGGDRDLEATVLGAQARVGFHTFTEVEEGIPDLESALARYDGEEGLTRALLLESLAEAYWFDEQYAAAVRAYEQALAATERALGPHHPRTVAVAVAYGGSLVGAGRFADSTRVLAATREAVHDAYSPTHSVVVAALQYEAGALTGLGRYDEAEARLAEAIAIVTEAYGENRAQLVVTHALLLHALVYAGRYDEALAMSATARELHALHTPDNVVLRCDLDLLEARAFEGVGRYDEARSRFVATEPIVREVMGPGTELAWALDGIGRSLVRAGRPDEAVALHEEALAIRDDIEIPGSVAIANTLLPLGEALIAAGRPGDAATALERALGIVEGTEGDPLDVAEVRFALARAVSDDTGRAGALAASAAEIARASTYPRGARLTEAIAAWEDAP